MSHDIARHVIRHSPGMLRVLRVIVAGGQLYMLSYDARRGPGTCRLCGCTEIFGCSPRCFWIDAAHTLCSACAEVIRA